MKRFLALILIPCLIAESSTAATWSSMGNIGCPRASVTYPVNAEAMIVRSLFVRPKAGASAPKSAWQLRQTLGANAISRKSLSSGFYILLFTVGLGVVSRALYPSPPVNLYRIFGVNWADFAYALVLSWFVFQTRIPRKERAPFKPDQPISLFGFKDVRFNPDVSFAEVDRESANSLPHLVLNPRLLKSGSRGSLFWLRFRFYISGAAGHEALHGLGIRNEAVTYFGAQMLPLFVGSLVHFEMGGGLGALLLTVPLSLGLFSAFYVFLHTIDMTNLRTPTKWREILWIRPLKDELPRVGFAMVYQSIIRDLLTSMSQTIMNGGGNVWTWVQGLFSLLFLAAVSFLVLVGWGGYQGDNLIDDFDESNGRLKTKIMNLPTDMSYYSWVFNRVSAYVLVIATTAFGNVFLLQHDLMEYESIFIYVSWLVMGVAAGYNVFRMWQYNRFIRALRDAGSPDGFFVGPMPLAHRNTPANSDFDQKVVHWIAGELPSQGRVLFVSERSGILVLRELMLDAKNVFRMDTYKQRGSNSPWRGHFPVFADRGSLPFLDGSQNAVVFTQSVNGTTDERLASEAYRILCPAGFLAIPLAEHLKEDEFVRTEQMLAKQGFTDIKPFRWLLDFRDQSHYLIHARKPTDREDREPVTTSGRPQVYLATAA